MTPDRWKEIERLYHACVELEPSRRAQFLDAACADEQMRRELESLLAHREDGPSFIERRGLDVASELATGDVVQDLAGRALGPYQILSSIGAGGMGIVYRARDTRLGRDVAIKVLPERYVSDPDHLKYFEREARAASALTHPNIVTVHDVGQSEFGSYIAMEFVDGKTLREILAGGPLPAKQILRIAAQAAAGLARAHAADILHRDLKPENLMVNKDGLVKILDFGVAKLIGSKGRLQASAETGTTYTGVILGTAGYMSPEQASGRRTDFRSDQFSLGAILYEMATGKRAFQRATPAETLAAIIGEEPEPVASLNSKLIPPIRWIIDRCLAKNPDERYASTEDLARELETLRNHFSDVNDWNALERSPNVAAAPVPGLGRFRRWALPVVAASIILGAWIGWLATRTPAEAPALARFKMGIQPAQQLSVNAQRWQRPSRTVMAFSPDGRTVVFSAIGQNGTQLFSRSLDQTEAVPIPGTEGAAGPFFSPDGKWVGFSAGGKINKVSIEGGPPVPICAIPGNLAGWGATWAEDDTIYFSFSPQGAILKAPAAGGKPELWLTPNAAIGEQFLLPRAVPGGKALLLTVRKAFDSETAKVELLVLETRERRLLLEDAADARYVPSGHLVYMKRGTLMAVPFDIRQLQVTGDPVALIENVMQSVNMSPTDQETTAGQFAISESGTLLYLTGGIRPFGETVLVLLNRKGEVQLASLPTFQPSVALDAPRFSPDNKSVTVRRHSGGQAEVWVYDLHGNGFQRMTFTQTNPYAAIWSPDGKRLVYSSDVSGFHNLYVVNADGTSPPEQLTTGNEYRHFASSWTATGNVIALMRERPSEIRELWTSELWTLRMEDKRMELFLKNPAPGVRLQYPEFSPDGRWIAYVSDETGQNEVWVRAYPKGREQYKVSSGRGSAPIWTSGGKEILYRNQVGGVQSFFSVAITNLNPFQTAPPQKLFQVERPGYLSLLGIRSWDATADGQQLLLVRPEDTKDMPVNEFEVILNWTQELTRRVTAK
jgi:serine/threonine-protein kinase